MPAASEASNPVSGRKVTKADVQRQLQGLQSRVREIATVEAAPLQRAYREAACVLGFFDPLTIRPYGAEKLEGPYFELLADSTRTFGRSKAPAWSLRAQIRKSTLRDLAARSEIWAALQCNPDDGTDWFRKMLGAYVNNTASPVELQTIEQLTATMDVVTMLEGGIEGLPAKGDIENTLEFKRLLAPFRHLGGDHFRGRKAELQRLRDYVGVLPPGSIFTPSFWTRVLNIISLHANPPLYIHGIGGMGKSALLARFILDHADLPQEQRFPFAYLDFDRPGLVPEEPLSLIGEALRQIGIQYPAYKMVCEKERQEIASTVFQPAADDANPPQEMMSPGVVSSLHERMDAATRLNSVLTPICAGQKPFLLVLDTFEEVQYRSRAFLQDLWDFFATMQQSIPRLRIVAAGRAPLGSDFKNDPLSLDALDLESAISFLQVHGIDDTEFAKKVAKTYGGNPLTLKLIAELVRKSGATREDIFAVKTRNKFFWKTKTVLLQGQFYDRILGHIHEDKVRDLAHPGLVLRRITPDVITKVLAGPCKISVSSQAEARELFDGLAREDVLVTADRTVEEGDVLLHRQDVRKVMIDMLRTSEPAKVVEIHQRAIDYYQGRSGLIARAEEIYHRLASGADPVSFDNRWEPGVELYLTTALSELSPRAQGALASRLGVELDPEIVADTNLPDWERHTERKIRDMMAIGREEVLRQALTLLQEREERSEDSPLFLVEAQVLERLDMRREARAAVGIARQAARLRGDEKTRVAARIVRARLAEREGRVRTARRLLSRAFETAATMGDRPVMSEIASHFSKVRWFSTGDFGSEQLSKEKLSQGLVAMANKLAADSEQPQLRSPEGITDIGRLVAFTPYFGRAFRDESSIEELMKSRFSVRLKNVAPGGGALSVILFEVTEWAARTGLLPKLCAEVRLRLSSDDQAAFDKLGFSLPELNP